MPQPVLKVAPAAPVWHHWFASTDRGAAEAADATKLERMTHGARAMRDSSSIYLSYAKFIAYGMPDSEEMIQDDIQS